MKILILTSRFGMGHYCAAEAIKEDLLESDSDDIIEIVDIIEALYPSIYKFIYSFFNLFICKFSGVYNFINRCATKHENACFNKRSLNKINSLIGKYDPELIISSWSACSRYISGYKKEYNNDIPLYTYITDITAHDGWITDMTDMYFVATKSTMESLVAKGVEPSKIIVNGIPVRKSFKEEQQIKFIDDYDIQRGKKEILIMGGGLGLIPELNKIIDRLYEVQDVHITIITGKNKKLFKKIKQDYPKIEVVGYTDQVNRYMNRADLIITKPGGISTFEAIYTTTPLYIIKPFLSQEVGNAKFIEKMIIGKVAWQDDIDISEDILSLISNDKYIGEMKYNMQLLRREFSKHNLKRFYEGKNKKDVDYNIANNYSTIFNYIWNYSNISL